MYHRREEARLLLYLVHDETYQVRRQEEDDEPRVVHRVVRRSRREHETEADDGSTLSYDETTVLQMTELPDQLDHTDRNVLQRVD